MMVLSHTKDHKEDINSLIERISKEVSITSVTIKDTYQQVYKYQDKLLPSYLLNSNDSRGYK